MAPRTRGSLPIAQGGGYRACKVWLEQWRSFACSTDAARMAPACCHESKRGAVQRPQEGEYPAGPERIFAIGPGGFGTALVLFALATLLIRWPWLSGRRDHPLGRQGALPASDPVPGAEPGCRAIALLGTLRLQRPSADRRPAGDDLLPTLSGALAADGEPEPLGGGRHRGGNRVPRRGGAHAVVPRPGLALDGRARRRAGVLLRRVDGLARPAHRRGAEPGLSAHRASVPRPRTGASLDRLRRRRRARCRADRARARPDRAARPLSPDRLRALAPSVGCRPMAGDPREPAAARRRGSRRRRDHRRARDPDGAARRGVQPRHHRLCRRRTRLPAPRAPAHRHHARPLRRGGTHGGLLGPAELRVGRHRPLHRPEHGRALHGRGAAGAARHRGPARQSVGARDPVLCRCGHRGAHLRARPLYPVPLRRVSLGSGCRSLPAAGRRNLPHRRACRHPRRLRRAPALCQRAPRDRAAAHRGPGRRARAGVRRRRGTGAMASPPRSPVAAVCRRGHRVQRRRAGTRVRQTKHRAPAGPGGRRPLRRDRHGPCLQQRAELLHGPAALRLRRALAHHSQSHHRLPQIEDRRRRHAPRPHRACRPRLPLAQRQPHAQAWRTRSATTPSASRSTAGRSARTTTSASPTSASSRPSFLRTAPRSPTCWACASSPPAFPSRGWTRP